MKLAGDLVITDNKAARPTGELTYCAAVHANTPGFSTSLIYFGGRLKIHGNQPADFCADYGKNKISIMEDLDVSPENHAWIGMAAAAGQDYIDYTFEDGFRKEYTACFFGNDVGGTYYEPLGYVFMDAPYVMGVSHKTGHIDEMKLNESGIKGSDGAALKKGTDYTISYDSLMREFTINAKQTVALEAAEKLFTNKNSKCNGAAKLVRTNTEESLEGTTCTYYYLCENYLYAEPYLVHNTSYNMVKESYYTVKVFVEGPKFFRNCSVNGCLICGIAPATDAESFVKNYSASDEIEITVNAEDGIIAAGTEITVKYSDKEYSYTAVVTGDLNRDGMCDARDSVIVNSIISGMLSAEKAGEAVMSAADMNSDGVIDTADVQLMEMSGMAIN